MRTTLFRRVMAGAILLSSVVGANFWATATTHAETDIENIQIIRPITATFFNPCAQEYVTFTGEHHLQAHRTFTENGMINVQAHSNYVNVSGVGNRSGAVYHILNGSNTHYRLEREIINWPLVASYQTSFRFIGAGDTANSMYWFNTHLTINENGEVITDFEHFHSECNGTPLSPYPEP